MYNDKRVSFHIFFEELSVHCCPVLLVLPSGGHASLLCPQWLDGPQGASGGHGGLECWGGAVHGPPAFSCCDSWQGVYRINLRRIEIAHF